MTESEANASCAVPLSELGPGESGVVCALDAEGHLRRRLLDIGFVVGREVRVVRESPFGDPFACKVVGATYALRRSDARMVKVRRVRDSAAKGRTRSGPRGKP